MVIDMENNVWLFSENYYRQLKAKRQKVSTRYRVIIDMKKNN
jgi:hypothetical protein